MRRRLTLLLVCAAVVAAACGGGQAASQPPASPSATKTVAATPAPTPTATPEPTATPAPTPTPAIDETWVTLAPDGAGFTAKFPGDPKKQTQTQKTQAGDAQVSMWTYVVNSHLVLIVGTSAYAAGTTTGVSPAAMYDGAIKGMEGSTGTTLQKQEDTTLNGHPARDFIASSASVSLAGRLCVVNDVLYMVYATFDAQADEATISAFIDDFELTV